MPHLRFRFQLQPIDGIRPWTDGDGNPAPLHWFALTLGWYWIEAGEHELFRFSDAALKDWEAAGYSYTLPYADYQVARFWEDSLKLVRHALHPVPEDIAARLADPDAWEDFCERTWDPENSDLWYDALTWRNERRLSFGHMVLQDIDLWRVGDTMTLRWDGRQRHPDGKPIPLWPAPERGEVSVPVDEFIAMMRAFDADLMAQMAPRCAGFPDRERTHAYCKTLLENALTHPRPDDWDATREALEKLERVIG